MQPGNERDRSEDRKSKEDQDKGKKRAKKQACKEKAPKSPKKIKAAGGGEEMLLENMGPSQKVSTKASSQNKS